MNAKVLARPCELLHMPQASVAATHMSPSMCVSVCLCVGCHDFYLFVIKCIYSVSQVCILCLVRDAAQKGWHFNPQLIACVSGSMSVCASRCACVFVSDVMWLQPLETSCHCLGQVSGTGGWQVRLQSRLSKLSKDHKFQLKKMPNSSNFYAAG